MKFGASGNPALTWAMNVHAPAIVAEVFAASRIVAFSTGCVYPFVPVDGGGATEDTPAVPPPGDYAYSCVGRERMFEHFSARLGTAGRLVRLNYAIDMRYGVLHDIATKVLRRGADRSRPWATSTSSGRATPTPSALRCLAHATTPTTPLNVTGPQTLRVRWLAEEFARRFDRAAKLTGSEAPTGWLNDASRMVARVRAAARRRRSHARLDRRLALARHGQPRQADPLRGARWPLLTRLRLRRGADRAPAAGRRRGPVRRCRSRPAGTRWRPTGASCWTWGGATASAARAGQWIAQRAGAAAGTGHLLDQHGAGDPAGARPGPRHAPAVALPRRGRGERRRGRPRRHRARAGRSICRSAFATSIRSRAGTRSRVCAMRSTPPGGIVVRAATPDDLRAHLRLRSPAQRLRARPRFSTHLLSRAPALARVAERADGSARRLRARAGRISRPTYRPGRRRGRGDRPGAAEQRAGRRRPAARSSMSPTGMATFAAGSPQQGASAPRGFMRMLRGGTGPDRGCAAASSPSPDRSWRERGTPDRT